MTEVELKTKLSAILKTNRSMRVYLILREDDGSYAIKLADIKNADSDKVKELFENHLTNAIINDDDLKICELSISEERTHTIYHYDYENYPEILSVFNDFKLSNYLDDDLIKFSFNDNDLSKLFGYIIYIGNMEDGIVLFKQHYPVSLIKRDSFLLGVKKSDSRFELMTGCDILRLNGDIQMLKLNDQIYISNLNVLEKNIGFTELIKKAANETIVSIESLDILEDIQVLRDAAEDISFARKLSKVIKSSPIFQLKIPKNTIIEFTKKTKELSGKFKYSTSGNEIRLDTNESKKQFIKLMNDSFLRSELTNQFYETFAKDQMSAN